MFTRISSAVTALGAWTRDNPHRPYRPRTATRVDWPGIVTPLDPRPKI